MNEQNIDVEGIRKKLQALRANPPTYGASYHARMDACLAMLPEPEAPKCERCGKPCILEESFFIGDVPGHRTCRTCFDVWLPQFNDTLAAFLKPEEAAKPEATCRCGVVLVSVWAVRDDVALCSACAAKSKEAAPPEVPDGPYGVQCDDDGDWVVVDQHGMRMCYVPASIDKYQGRPIAWLFASAWELRREVTAARGLLADAKYLLGKETLVDPRGDELHDRILAHLADHGGKP